MVWRLRANRGDGIVCDGSPGRARVAAGSRDIEHAGSEHDTAKCRVLKAMADCGWQAGRRA